MRNAKVKRAWAAMERERDDARDFAGFCRNATDSQLVEIEAMERRAGRPGFAEIARAEAEKR